ncbi:hypothetical protein SY2F82_10050 [Streptomyces sp. Y2F8-2]|nr:hypothetical protein SY2F82_10050 [Streptomyces sp. Y2F8-2]
MRRSDEAWPFLGVGTPPVPLVMGENADNCGQKQGTWTYNHGIAGMTTVSTGQTAAIPALHPPTLFATMPEWNGW